MAEEVEVTDVTDVAWWYAHKLPLVEAIDPEGRMTGAAGDYAGAVEAFFTPVFVSVSVPQRSPVCGPVGTACSVNVDAVAAAIDRL